MAGGAYLTQALQYQVDANDFKKIGSEIEIY